MLQTVGLGKLKPNTVVLGYKRNWRTLWKTPEGKNLVEEYVNIVHDAFELNNGVAILRLRGEPTDDNVCKPDTENTASVPQPDSLGPLSPKGQIESSGKVFHVKRSTLPDTVEQTDVKTEETNDETSLSKSQVLQVSTSHLADHPESNFKHSSVNECQPDKVDSDDDGDGEKEVLVANKEGKSPIDKKKEIAGDEDEKITGDSKELTKLSETKSEGKFIVTVTEEPIEEKDEETEVDETAKLRGSEPTTTDIEAALKEKPKGTIDVWWLWDDGGLTILIPYLLSTHSYWKGCKLRIFTLASTSILDRRELRMANLMKKFRIDFSGIVEVQGINTRPSSQSIDNFMTLPVREEFGDVRTLEKDKKTMRNIRLGELIREHSNDAKLLVLTLPVPKVEVTSALLYMSWLEVLSAVSPPVLMIRGNQQSVLTFYS